MIVKKTLSGLLMAIIWNINKMDEIISRIKRITNLDEEIIEI